MSYCGSNVVVVLEYITIIIPCDDCCQTMVVVVVVGSDFGIGNLVASMPLWQHQHFVFVAIIVVEE